MTKTHRYPAGAALLAVLAALTLTACKQPSIAQVQASLEVVNLQTKWVVKEYKQWPQPKLVLVPVAQFQVRNKSVEPLKNINFNAIFKKPDEKENRGDNFLATIRDQPILPGAESPVVVLKSNFGLEGRNLEHFKLYPKELTYVVKIFAQYGGSRPSLLGEFPVSGEIDFKPDAPVHMDGKKIDQVIPVVPVKPEPKK
jgi:hypothetical protein